MRTRTGLDLQADMRVKATNTAEAMTRRVKSWKNSNGLAPDNDPKPVFMRLNTINAITTNIIAVKIIAIFVVLGSGILRYLTEIPVYLYLRIPWLV